MNSETDFVSRGASFRKLAHNIVNQSVGIAPIIPRNAIDPIDIEGIFMHLSLFSITEISKIYAWTFFFILKGG